MTADKAKNLRIGMERVLNDYLKSIGLNADVDFGNTKYDAISANFSFTIREGTENASPEQANFYAHCGEYGLRNEDYLQTVRVDGKILQIYNFNSRARKYPLLARDFNTGKEYGITVDTYLSKKGEI